MAALADEHLLDTLLTRAAEVIGDITQPVLNRYYERFPEARDQFQLHGAENSERLQAEMVECTLYYLMAWIGDQDMVQIALSGSADHHAKTLHIDPEQFSGLIAAVHDVVAETIPAGNDEETALWSSVRDGLDAVCTRVWNGCQKIGLTPVMG